MGVEPIRCCHHGILSPARLPIPSRRHTVFLPKGNGTIVAQLFGDYNQFFSVFSSEETDFSLLLSSSASVFEVIIYDQLQVSIFL